ncbi:MAG: hypothetical protein QF886_12570, partial [Planctomycetota bacterium]|nr:hypothetical protein [Planctomycetota bacterium]
FLNIGGGLAIDYDGSHTSDFSSDYSLEEYCDRIVSIVKTVCDSEEVPHPTLVSESGRFVAAHHSMLAVDVRGLDSSDHLFPEVTTNGNEPSRITELRGLLDGMSDAQVRRQSRRALELQRALAEDFNRGELPLQDRATSERLLRRIAEKAHQLDPDVSGLQLQKFLRQHFVCNFSVFQSLPDNLLVKQVFPIIPLQRLNEKPDNSTTLVDITCDSDGRVDRFAHSARNQSNLLVHSLDEQDKKEPYYLGFFLMGAYQDIMGDVHNLFGTANEVSVNILDNGKWEIENIIKGDSCADVLGYVGYNKEELLQLLDKQIDELDTVGADEKNEMISQYEELLDDQTYMGRA